MKKRILILLTAVLCLVCTLTLISCDEGDTPEGEAPSTVCQHRDADDDSLCDKCGENYTDGTDVTPEHTHAWGEWVETTPPTCVAKGIKVRVCTCGQSDTQDVEASHTPASVWLSDGTHHWQVCTQAGCGVDLNKATHDYDAENTCTVCEHYKDEGVRFAINSSLTFDVVEYTGNATEVIIPSKFKGIPVTGIGEEAFYGCRNLTSVTIPSSVTGIGNRAFSGCTGLIQKEGGVHYVDKWAVGCDSSVTSVTLRANTVGIGAQAFCGCSRLKSITIPSSVTVIGEVAFLGCDSLTSITIPDGVISIGFSAFQSCCNLTSVTIPSSVRSIGNGAFFNCISLKSITIPSSVTSIGTGAFKDCRGLESIIVANGNTVYHSAGNCLIETASKTLIRGCKNSVIPADGSVTSIGAEAFYNYTSLTSITIPSSVTGIGYRAFDRCTGLIQIENGVHYVDKWVVSCDSSVTSVTLRANTVGIGNGAFSSCSSLTSITIPSSVTNIGDWVFLNCSSLTSLKIPSSVTGIGYRVFAGCKNLATVTFEACSQLTSIGVEAFSDCSSLTSITIPSSVTVIGEMAFYNCNSLTSITIPSSVTSIGEGVFESCDNLTIITISSSVTGIGNWAFYNCNRLTTINYCGTEAQWDKISKGTGWNSGTGNYTIVYDYTVD